MMETVQASTPRPSYDITLTTGLEVKNHIVWMLQSVHTGHEGPAEFCKHEICAETGTILELLAEDLRTLKN